MSKQWKTKVVKQIVRQMQYSVTNGKAIVKVNAIVFGQQINVSNKCIKINKEGTTKMVRKYLRYEQ